MFVDHFRDSFLGGSADHALLFVAAFKENERRNSLDAVPLRDRWIVVDVQFHHAAWRTPCCPEIYQHRLGRLQYILLEGNVSDFDYMFAHVLSSPLSESADA